MPVPLSPTGPVMPAGVKLRDFADVSALRQAVFDNVLGEVKKIQPVSNSKYSLSIENPHYPTLEPKTPDDEKKAVLSGRSLMQPLRGSLVLRDLEQNKELSRKDLTLVNVPYLADTGRFVINGNGYAVSNQRRLLPGAFTRRKQNGELTTHINTLPGAGVSHHVFMDPATGIFRLQVQQAQLPLLPILQGLGVPESKIQEAWGADMLIQNKKRTNPAALQKFFEKLYRRPAGEADDIKKLVAEKLAQTKLDPAIMQRTLGVPYTSLDPDAYLAITRKLLDVNAGKSDPDDRDDLPYQTFLGPEDLIAERFRLAKGAMLPILWKAVRKNNLDHVPPGVFDRIVRDFITGSGLASPGEEVNPAEITDQLTRVTSMGVGGLANADSIPEESRAVQPSHYGFIDTLRTTESTTAGIDLRFAGGAKKGSDGNIYAPLRNVRTGQLEYKSAKDLVGKPLAIAGELGGNKRWIKVVHNNQLTYAPRNEIEYEVPDHEATYSLVANLVNEKSSDKGQRAVMASRMLTQALPLVKPEAPYVSTGTDGGESYYKLIGKHFGVIRAGEQPGVVTDVGDTKITVKYADGSRKTHNLYKNMPFNRKTPFTQTALVKPGDQVSPGQLLAKSNFTDDEGNAALGLNMRVGYVPYKGLDYEDAIVLSESAAKRLTSQHMYKSALDRTNEHTNSKKAFVSLFPAKYTADFLKRYDDDGLLRPGEKVNYGEPLILSARRKQYTQNQLNRGKIAAFSDDSILWDSEAPGVVTDTHYAGGRANVVVSAEKPMRVGDKLSGRHGDKGVISEILPDHIMPHTRDGRPLDVLVGSMGLISRVNAAQILEASLGKIAEKTGQRFSERAFQGQDAAKKALDLLKAHNLPDKEDVIFPENGRVAPNVLVGPRYMMKLHHNSEDKEQGHGLGGYSTDGVPTSSDSGSAKRLSMLDVFALMSSGATEVLRDAKLIRGQSTPEFWTTFMAGHNPQLPKVPMVYRKFVTQLQASGINPVRRGRKTQLMAMTDDDVSELAGSRKLENADTVDWKDIMRPTKGGLFDERLTGGHGNMDRWSYIELPEPMPSPVMEEPIRRLLDLTENEMLDVLAGNKELHGKTGPQALRSALAAIDVTKEIARARADIASGRTGRRDAAVRRLGFLKAAESTGIHPQKWMITKVPVLPPGYRPVSELGDKKLPMVADINLLYKDLFGAADVLKQIQGQVKDVGDERKTVYKALRAVVGLGDPVQEQNQERNVRGLLKQIFGNSPKYGTVTRRLLSTPVNMSGRAVITPDPELDMDHIGLPEKTAWSVYKPYIVRRLVRRGVPPMQAVDAVTKQSPLAKEELLAEISERPILASRAPVLHKWGIQAFYPILTKRSTISISPIVTKGFNADFDGDTMTYHVPHSAEAVKEAREKLLPSRNLRAIAKFDRTWFMPSQQFLGGIAEASVRRDDSPPMTFESRRAAISAWQRGEIPVGRRIRILEDS